MKKLILILAILLMAAGSGVCNGPPDFEGAKQAAEQGDSHAQCQLGLFYFFGIGDVSKDDEQAVYWFTKSAEQGHAAAQSSLGDCYYLGRGVPENYIQAYKWASLATILGDDHIRSNSTLLLQGLTLKMTPEQIEEGQKLVAEWYEKFQAKGNK